MSYLAEQLLHCDLLRLNLLTGRFVRIRRAFSQRPISFFCTQGTRTCTFWGVPLVCACVRQSGDSPFFVRKFCNYFTMSPALSVLLLHVLVHLEAKPSLSASLAPCQLPAHIFHTDHENLFANLTYLPPPVIHSAPLPSHFLLSRPLDSFHEFSNPFADSVSFT